MAVKVNVKSDATKDLMRDIEKFAVEEANDLIDDLHAVTKANTPVDSGMAKASWEQVNVRRMGDLGEIGNPQDYLKYVEDGTAHIAPRKFITRSIIKVLNTRK